MPKEEKIKVFCGLCQRETNHLVLCKRQISSSSEDDYRWSEDHYFCRCAGCDHYCYAIASETEDDWLHGDYEPSWKTYPKRAGELKPIDRTFDLPRKVRILYREIIDAVNVRLSILAAIGLRALVEAICKERGVSGNSLVELIDGLATNGVLSGEQAKILHSHRFMGNVAAHELQQAHWNEIEAALDIAESMIKAIYILPKLSEEITTGKPQASS